MKGRKPMSNQQQAPYDPDAPPIEEVLASIAAEVPKEEWDRLPPDLTDDLDHYIYGTPRQSPAAKH